ncbi:MAG: hypothetical protein GX605_10965 [Chloroflexi bacterium]|nr:hypothetical protein [Chloroflexota bacterium]
MSQRLRLSLVLTTVVLALLWTGVSARAQGGELLVQVLNGATGQPVAGQPVTLHTFAGMEAQSTKEGSTDADGRFRFSVSLAADRTFGVTAEYNGVSYASDLLTPQGEETELTALVQVYETTSDDAAIEIARSHLLVEFGDGVLRVGELYIMSNTGDRTYVGDASGRTLAFSLPEGATDIQVDNQAGPTDRFTLEATTLWDTAPLPPGDSLGQHLIGYTLPYTPEGTTLTRRYPYPMAQVNLLVSDAGVEVASDELSFAGAMGGQQQYLNWRGGALAAGQSWSATLRGQPQGAAAAAAVPSPASPQGTFSLEAALAAGLIMGMAPLVYLGTRRRRPSADPLALPADAQPLAQALADLDDAHAAGQVDQAAYERQRQALMARLRNALATRPNDGRGA